MRMRYIFPFVFFIAFLSNQVYAQQSVAKYSPSRTYNRAMDLFDKEKYSAAIKQYENVLEEINDPNAEIYSNAAFYKAVCGLHLSLIHI